MQKLKDKLKSQRDCADLYSEQSLIHDPKLILFFLNIKNKIAVVTSENEKSTKAFTVGFFYVDQPSAVTFFWISLHTGATFGVV